LAISAVSITRVQALCLVALTALSIPPGRARASSDLALEFTAPPGCPGSAEIQRAVDALLADAELERDVTVRGAVTARAEGDFVLTLEWRGPHGSGRRRLEAESCHTAADAAAWLIAIALRSPSTAPDREPIEARAEGAPLHPRFGFGMRAMSDFGVLPSVAFGAAIALGVAFESLHLELTGLYFPAQSLDRASVQAEFDLAELGLAGCYLVPSDDLALGPCVRAVLGRMAATARANTGAVIGAGDARVQSLAAAMQLRLRIAGDLGLFAEAALIWNQRRPAFTVSTLGTLHQPRSVGLQLGLGFGYALD
jgi:hypothetical protein